MIISVDEEKSSDKNQVQFMMKILSKVRIENFLNLVKNIYKMPTANVRLVGKKLSHWDQEQGKDVPLTVDFQHCIGSHN